MRYLINEDIKWAFRTEYYQDSKQIMIQTSTINGFQVFGLSSNVDFRISDKTQVRIEGKKYQSTDPIFENSKTNYSLTINLTLRF
jgi:Putative beta-barrel porin-2, OmpL-like. bbp2